MNGTSNAPTLFAEEPPVKPSPSLASERDWLTRVVTWHSSFLELLTASGPAGWYGRTCPECTRQLPTRLPISVLQTLRWKWDEKEGRWTSPAVIEQTKTMRSPASWPDFKNSGMVAPGELWTLNTLEFRNDAVAVSLSDILETGDLPQRYYLSPIACRGILRRAEKRGKELPEALRLALEQVAGSAPTSTSQEE